MEKLTNYFQAVKLVNAGVPKQSADYFFSKKRTTIAVPEFPYVPCWSAEALWNLLHESGKVYEFSTDLTFDELIEEMVNAICFSHEMER